MTVYATCHGCTFKGDCRARTLLCDARTSTLDQANVRWGLWAGDSCRLYAWRDGTISARGEMVGISPTHYRDLPAPPPKENHNG